MEYLIDEQSASLQETLTKIQKEVKGINETPDLPDIEKVFGAFKFAIELKDKEGIERYGRLLAAKVTKFIIDKL